MPKANKRKHESEKNVDNKRQKTSNKPIKGINDLPNEMLLNIFSYLGQNDILSATLVGKKWNNLISSTEKTMKKIQTIYIDTDNMIGRIPKFTRPYAKIELSNIKLECDLNLLNRLRRIGDGIKAIIFDHCWFLGNGMTSFLKCFKNLKTLHITHCEITTVPVQHKVILKDLDMLHLDISTWPLKYIETPKLTKLHCHTVLVEETKIIVHFLNQQRHLEELDFYCFYDLFQGSLHHLNPKFKLKKLKLNDLINYNKDQMMNLLSSMTESLTSIEIGYEVGRDITKYALQNFVNLESLSIDCDSLPNTPSFYHDIKTSQTLKRVEFGGDLKKTMTVLTFLDHHPEIEHLDMGLLYNIPSTRFSFWSRLAGVTQKLVSLNIESMDADNIRNIKNKNLKDIKIYSLDVIDNPDWIEFCQNNPNIERFHIFGLDNPFNINDVETVLRQHLAKLKNFSVEYSPALLE